MDIGIENEVKADSLNVDVKTYIYGSEGSGIKEDTIELNNAATDNINLSNERTDHKNEEYGFSDIEEQIGNEQEREVAIVQNSDTGNNGLLNVVLTFLTGLKNKIINFFI